MGGEGQEGEFRQIVLDRKLLRRMFVQVNTVLDIGRFNQGFDTLYRWSHTDFNLLQQA